MTFALSDDVKEKSPMISRVKAGNHRAYVASAEACY